MLKRKTENKILTIVVGIIVLLTTIVLVLGTPSAYAQSHYQIGYNDGCAVLAIKEDFLSLQLSLLRELTTSDL